MEVKIKEIDFESGDWHEQVLRNGLVSILNNMNDNKHNILLSNYLSFILSFLENCFHEGSLHNHEIIDLMQEINIRLGHKIFGTQNKKYENAIKIGFIVEFLFQMGLPRSQCIPEVANWLNIKSRTVRDYNESYRKKFGLQKIDGIMLSIVDRMFFFGAIRLDENPTVREIFERNPDFPDNHPKSKRAFQKCLRFIETDEIYNKWNKNLSMG